MTVAETILTQLGGRRFVVMTGSKKFMDMENGLRMDLSRNKSAANFLKIMLNGSDTYDMFFMNYKPIKVSNKSGVVKVTPDKLTKIAEFNGVYYDQLQEIFTQVTGLYTRL